MKNMAKIRIFDKEIKYKKIYRNVKYARFEFKTGNLQIILPRNTSNEINLIKKHQRWIYKKASFIEKIITDSKKLKLNFERSMNEFKLEIGQMAQNFARDIGVSINSVIFRKMKTKLGSCSCRGGLTINSLLRFLPEQLIEYIIFHEVLHRIHRNHRIRFQRAIEQRFPEHQNLEERLLAYWLLVKIAVRNNEIK